MCMVRMSECRCENDHGQVWLTVYSALCGVCEYVGVRIMTMGRVTVSLTYIGLY